MVQISYSSYDKYLTCPRLWSYHYIDKLRPDYLSSALFFGGAIGRIWQAIALTKKDNLTEEEKQEVKLAEDPIGNFRLLFNDLDLNGEKINPRHHKVWYFKGDYDGGLLKTEDWLILDQVAEDTNQVLPNGKVISFNDLIAKYPFFLDKNEMIYMNTHFELSLIQKGIMLIEAFQAQVFPNIIKVHAIEKPIKIDMSLPKDPELTDFLIGYIDMVCDYKVTDANVAIELGIPLNSIIKVLFDNKTSSTKYAPKKLTESRQLSIYDFYEQGAYVGYIVGIKSIKRPKRGAHIGLTFAEMQVMIGKSDRVLQDDTLDKVETMLQDLTQENYPKNEKDCKWIFGRRCAYYDLCYGGKLDGLIKKGDINE